MDIVEYERAETQPYCQIAGQTISAEHCGKIQGQEECFGCAAPTRLCEVCKETPTAVPAVGMCDHCLAKKLEEEANTKESTLVIEAVTCQIVHKPIKVATCIASQGGDGCRNCAAPSRICIDCGKYSSRFPQYGLCLACSVKEYGDNWEAPQKLQTKTERKVITQNLCKECNERPVFVKSRGLCPRCANIFYARNRAAGIQVRQEVLAPAKTVRDYKVKVNIKKTSASDSHARSKQVTRIRAKDAHRREKTRAMFATATNPTARVIERIKILETLVGKESSLGFIIRDVLRYLDERDVLKQLLPDIAKTKEVGHLRDMLLQLAARL